MPKLTATPVIEDKFYIVESHGSKVGTLKSSTSGYIFYNNIDNTETLHTDLSFFSIKEKKSKTYVNDTVYGYQTNTEMAYDKSLLDNVPVYKKTATSQQYFAAGYYGIKFPRLGWSDAFCPRLKTLNDYDYIGPFKNLSDVQLAIKRQG
jgi:hypothetical protein